MGQKVNPIGLRLGINRTWDSRWYADDEYANLLHEDLKLRDFLFKRLNQAGISRVVIERPAKRARVTIHTARPGVVIGKKGTDIEALRQELIKMIGNEVALNIVEEYLEEIIRIEREMSPGAGFAVLPTVGGQTALRERVRGPELAGAVSHAE